MWMWWSCWSEDWSIIKIQLFFSMLSYECVNCFGRCAFYKFILSTISIFNFTNNYYCALCVLLLLVLASCIWFGSLLSRRARTGQMIGVFIIMQLFFSFQFYECVKVNYFVRYAVFKICIISYIQFYKQLFLCMVRLAGFGFVYSWMYWSFILSFSISLL
jgi:hypothetical protein